MYMEKKNRKRADYKRLRIYICSDLFLGAGQETVRLPAFIMSGICNGCRAASARLGYEH